MLRNLPMTEYEKDYIFERLVWFKFQIKESFYDLEYQGLEGSKSYSELKHIDWSVDLVKKGFGVNHNMLALEKAWREYRQLLRSLNL